MTGGPPDLPVPTRLQWGLIIAVLLCYGIGYPVALLAHSSLGWLLVGAGGLPLVALAAVTVRRIYLSDRRSRPGDRL